MKEYVLRNARVVTPTTVMHGHVLVRDGLVADVDEGDIQPTAALECIDCEGDYLLPGFVELHTDNLEKHLVPRPKVVWPQAEPAFFAHDAQIVAAGITTVFDALSVGEYHDKGRIAMLGRGVDALNHCRQSGMLRADHLLHLRCEVADPRMRDLFFPLSDTPCLKLVSLMDHTPGQRQWRDTTAYRTYYSNIKSWTDEEFTAMMHELEEVRDSCANDNAASVMEFCRQRHLPMASHDDTGGTCGGGPEQRHLHQRVPHHHGGCLLRLGKRDARHDGGPQCRARRVPFRQCLGSGRGQRRASGGPVLRLRARQPAGRGL